MANSEDGKKILFICLGNICRSPTAEAVLNHVLKERNMTNWDVDSAAIGSWHVGLGPDSRAVSVMKRHNIPMKHKARQLTKADFVHYDYIFGMDHDNISDIKARAPKTYTARIELFGSYDLKKELIIRDPYYDDDDAGFEKCYEQCLRCSNGFLDSLK
ncbi:low molecular weight phosphotyrosine protein phosphatase-like [Homarus americanus]|uniref:low molecular weight phosphotyrosine protein phosphatase-like n=1 Tax=Homarus americanus TaxID=6706 RepID=UPI001C47853B|nr:low molecular weight phosphotyrosine protein phosphatase-like [Homarus americanus]